jgi:hypothetical protein
MQHFYFACMYLMNAEPHGVDRLGGDHGRSHSRTGAHPLARQWQPQWWSTRPAPTPNWLERLERGAPLPRLLRR